ncbi:MAG: ATP-binding protein [Peptostreptococcaceae bacterium]
MISFSKKKLKEPKGKKVKATTAQKSIPYEQIFEDGLIEVRKGVYSKSLHFIDINYQIARQEDRESMFLDYCSLINSFDSTLSIQITVNNKNMDKLDFENKILLKRKGDRLDEYRVEYNSMLRKQVAEGKNEINREKYITVTTKATDAMEARGIFTRLEGELQSNIRKLGSNSIVLKAENRLKILHDFYRLGHEGTFVYEPRFRREKGISAKDIISPDSFEFKRNYFMMGEKYGRALFLRDLPTFLNDKFMSEITDISFNMMVSMNINSVEPEKALKLVKKQITGMESNKIDYQKKAFKEGYSDAFIPHDLQHSLDEAQELLDDLVNKNQKMFIMNFIVVHIADSLDELDKQTETISSVARKYLCQIGTLNYQQEDGLASALPLGNNRLNIQRTLTTESTAVFMPFSAQDLIQEGGMYYGLNAVSRNLVIFNRRSGKNANGFILGTPGSGKSFSAKREMVNVLLNTDDDIIIIDPEREYTSLATGFYGEIINISASSKNHINPLDMTESYADDENPIALKSEFILSLCECLFGGKTGLSPKQKTIIDRCVHKTYAKYIQDFDINKVPTLSDFYNTLKNEEESEAKDIALNLELYTEGSLSTFANKTNIEMNNRLIVFDTKDLGKQLKTMGMLIVLDGVWNRITLNRSIGKNTWIYMDEIYLLFQNEYSANFLFELYKRARKWGGIPTGITQNVEDLLKSHLARTMLSNSDFVLMLNQAYSDRKVLADLLNISDTQLSYVTNSDEGQGLLFCGNSIIPFVDKFPRDTKLYKMMTTKVDEINEIKKELT